jgi:hypothetical protein
MPKRIPYIPATAATGVVEVDLNYRDKLLQLRFMVEDDGVFTMLWSATITYRPNLGPWSEVICAENLQKVPRKELGSPRGG